MFERRLRVVAVLGLLYLLLLLGTLFKMQVLDAGVYRQKGRALSQGRIRLPARRGTILDRHGTVLAADRREWDLVVRLDHLDGSSWLCGECGRPAVSVTEKAPRRCQSCRASAFEALDPGGQGSVAELLGMAEDEFESCLTAIRVDWKNHVEREIKRLEEEKTRYRKSKVQEQYLGWNWVVAENVDPAVVKEVSLHPDRYRGFSILSVFRRANHQGTATRRIVGATSGVYREEKQELKESGLNLSQIYRMRFGRSGLEKMLQDRLASRDGYRIVDRDSRRRVREVLDEEPAKDGETIRISLDLPLQERMAKELAVEGRKQGARGAAFVAMDPATGEVLVFAGYRGPGKKGVNLDVAPVVPGSVFKVVTAIAALETVSTSSEKNFDCTGEWHGIGCHRQVHGWLDTREALEISCNGYFAWAGGEVGIDALADWARRLGFGAKTGLQISGEAKGLVPDPQWKADRFERDKAFQKYVGDPGWHDGETWQVGFGQGALSVTPVQVARLMAIVANGGRYVEPTLLLGEGRPGASLVSAGTLAILHEGLGDVVDTGTAKKTDLRRHRAAGKTGTGDLPHSLRNVAWFAGYAPRENPQIAFACCFVDVKGSGGDVAGPLCATFLAEFTK